MQKELCDGDADAESRYSREILQRVCSVQLFVFVMGLCVDMRCSAVAFVAWCFCWLAYSNKQVQNMLCPDNLSTDSDSVHKHNISILCYQTLNTIENAKSSLIVQCCVWQNNTFSYLLSPYCDYSKTMINIISETLYFRNQTVIYLCK